MPIAVKERVRFGPYELNTYAGELYKHGLRLKLQGHPIQILAMLLERPGELITREEIRQKLWPSESQTFVDFEHGLNTAVRKLRQALGDEAEMPQYLETLPRRGYRFVGEIAPRNVAQAKETGSPGSAIQSTSIPRADLLQRKSRIYRLLLVSIASAVLLGTTAWLLRHELRAPEPLKITGTEADYLQCFGGLLFANL